MIHQGGQSIEGIRSHHRWISFLLGFFPFFSIAATNIIIFLLATVWIVDMVRKRTTLSFHRTPFDVVLMIYFLLWLVSAMVGFSPFESIKKVGNFQNALVFYLLLFVYGGSLIPSALCGMGSGAGLNILYGWGQFILWNMICDFPRGDIPSWFLGLSPKWQSYFSLSAINNRIHGALHLMTYSELLIPPLLFFGARFLEKGKSLLFLVGYFLSGVTLVLTSQRGPFFLGAVMGLFLIIVVHPRRMRLVIPLLLLVALVWINPVFRTKISSISSAEGVRANHRVALWEGGLYIFSRHPLFGVGPGQIKRAAEIYNREPDFPHNPRGQAGDLHNYYLQRLVEMGIPGFLVSCWLLWVMVKTGHAFYQNRGSVVESFPNWNPATINALSLAIFSSFFSFLFFNFTERAFDDAEVAFVFWMMAASSVWFVRQSKRGINGLNPPSF